MAIHHEPAPGSESSGTAAPSPSSAARWRSAEAQAPVYEAYEIFSVTAERCFSPMSGIAPENAVAGRWIVCGGMGRRGGAQPLAATLAGAAFLGIDVDAGRIKSRLKSGECDFLVNSLDEALRILKNAVRKRENLSVGLAGNCAALLPEMAARGVVPDMVTDQTPLLDASAGYLPGGMTPAEACALRERDAAEYERRANESIRHHLEALLRLREMGSILMDTGNGLAEAARSTVPGGAAIPESTAAYGAALAAEGSLLRWAALSGEARDGAAIDALVLEMFPEKARLRRWIEQARVRIRSQNPPARILRLATEERIALARAVNTMVREGPLKGPVVFEPRISGPAACWGASLVADGSREAAERIEAGLRR